MTDKQKLIDRILAKVESVIDEAEFDMNELELLLDEFVVDQAIGNALLLATYKQNGGELA